MRRALLLAAAAAAVPTAHKAVGIVPVTPTGGTSTKLTPTP
jgi:hypothetical protein